MMKTIGYCNGRKVLYSMSGIVRVEKTNILICGCRNEADAVERAERNLVGFMSLNKKSK